MRDFLMFPIRCLSVFIWCLLACFEFIPYLTGALCAYLYWYYSVGFSIMHNHMIAIRKSQSESEEETQS